MSPKAIQKAVTRQAVLEALQDSAVLETIANAIKGNVVSELRKVIDANMEVIQNIKVALEEKYKAISVLKTK